MTRQTGVSIRTGSRFRGVRSALVVVLLLAVSVVCLRLSAGGGADALGNAILTSNTSFGITGSVSNLAPGYAASGNLAVTVTNPYTVPIDLLSVTVQVTAVDAAGSSTPVTGCPGAQLSLDGSPFSGSTPQATASFSPTAYPVGAGGQAVVPLTLLLARTAGNACQGVSFQFAYAGTATYGLTQSCINKTLNGGYTVRSGQAVCIEGRVNGGLTVDAGGAVYVSGATIDGGFTSTGAVAVEVCGSSVNGGMSISGNTGFLMVGDDGDDPGEGSACAGNSISGSVDVTGAGAGFEFGGNTLVTSAVTVTDNAGTGPTAEDAVPEVEGNTMKTLSCSGNAALSDGGQVNTASSKTGQCAVGF